MHKRVAMLEGVHGDRVISMVETFEVVDLEDSYVCLKVDNVYNQHLDKELPGIVIETQQNDGPVNSVVLSPEIMEKMYEWYLYRRKLLDG